MAVFRCQRSMGETVYARHAPERAPMIITAVTFSPAGGYIYACSWPTGETTTHYECELVSQWTGYLGDDDDDEDYDDDDDDDRDADSDDRL